MTSADEVVVRREIVVKAPIEKAFATFVERFGDFKPPEHNLLGSPIARTTFDHAGGWAHLRRRRGRERVPVGPGPRLRTPGPGGVQLGHQPVLADPERPGNASEVEVRFVAESPDRTRLELEHRHLDRHGPGWESVREGVDGDAGWPLYLARYADLLTGGS